jgi:hypothetical protein
MSTTAATAEIKIGSIFASSWGYEQTNVSFYRVVKATAKTVTVQKVKSERVTGGDMCGEVIATTTPAEAVTYRRTVSYYSNAPSIKIEDCERAYLWHGRPMSVTSYY